MTIHLRPELEELKKQDVQRGPYQSIEEYVERAVQMLHEEEELLAREKDSIGAQIASGLAQLDRGEGISGDVARARMQERKVIWQAEQRRE
jgi:Arc/MetJ-type ribon-helix-helix transcriptional regulator